MTTRTHVPCEKCGKNISKSNYTRHVDACGKPKPLKKIRGVDFDPNHGYKSGERVAWNKGLTKETDSRVAANSISVSNAMKGNAPPWEWTSERRKAKSEWRKKLYQEHPETHPNRRLAKNRKKWTYPERVAAEYLDSREIKYEYNKKIGKYYPDFWIVDTNLLIEIDGERWHDPDKDAARDAVLNTLGYIVYRIKAKLDIHNELSIILERNNISV